MRELPVESLFTLYFVIILRIVSKNIIIIIDPADSIARLVSTIKDVFTAHVAKLSSLLKPTIREIATEMDQEGLISQAVARDPNVLYTTIIDQFLAGLGFKEQRKIEEQCLKFFNILHNIGGPVQGASEVMKDKLIKEVKTKLNIDLNLESECTNSH